MKTLIDNTSLHSASKVFRNEKFNDTNLKDLLQLCNLLIFSDEIHIGGLDYDKVRDFSSEMIFDLRKKGVSEQILILDNHKPDLFKKICNETAKSFANYPNFSIDKAVIVDCENLRPNTNSIPINTIGKYPDFNKILNSSITEKELNELSEIYYQNKMVGVFHFLLTAYPEIRDVFQKYSSNRVIDENEMGRLDAIMRVLVNENLAKHNNHLYIPSIARSSVVRNNNKYLLELVEKTIQNKEDTDIWNIEGIFPSITKYLISKSNHNPNNFIEISLEAREKTRDLRKWFIKLSEKYNLNKDSDRYDILKEFDSLKESLIAELNNEKPQFYDAFELTFSNLIFPKIKIKNSELVNYLKFRKNSKRNLLLSEISKSNIFSKLKIETSEIRKVLEKNNRFN